MKFAVLVVLSLFSAQAATPVLTRSYNNGRTGADMTETVFTPQLVASKGLKRIKSLTIDDDPRVEAQPLYVPDLTMKDGQKHDVIFVASMGNRIFAFDANANAGQDLLWKVKLGIPFQPAEQHKPDGHRTTAIDDAGINIKWGILSTPVIDIDAGRIYVVNWMVQNGKRALFAHRVNLKDGVEVGQPVAIHGKLLDNLGHPVMDADGKPVQLHADQKQRAALLLAPLHGQHKTLFVATTGGEQPGDPHGWMVAIDVDSFTQTAEWVATRKGFGGGMWQGSQGPSADNDGNVYAMTANGGFAIQNHNAVNFNGDTDFAEAFVKLKYDKNAGKLTLADWFIPFLDAQRHEVAGYDYRDQDLGSSAPILPEGTGLLLGAGKDGLLYVLDRNHLGKKVGDLDVLKSPPIYVTYNGVGLPTHGPQIDFALVPGANPNKTHHLHGSPVYWDGSKGPMLFAWGENESLRAWTVDAATGKVSFVAKGGEVASAALANAPDGRGGMTGGLLAVSSNGKNANTGIVWTLAPIDGDANRDVVEGIARAYDATELDPHPIDPQTPRMKLIWDSKKAGVKFNFSKFCTPVVADGKLLVPTYSGRVDVYVLNH
jgi:hypothetical protein